MALSNYSPSASLNTSISGINIGEGMERDEVNNALRQIMADVAPLGGSVLGTIQSGSTNGFEVSRTFNGAADGTSQFYGQVHRVYAQGSNGIDYVRNGYYGTHIDTTAGVVVNADGLHQYVWASGAGNVTFATGIASHIRVDGPGDITNEARCFRAVSTTVGATATIARVVGYSVGDIGDATKVTDAFGVDVPDLAASGSAIAYRALMTAGANKYAFFGGGTAQSALGGFLGVGMTSAPSYQLQVVATAANFSADVGNSHASNPFGLRVRYTGAAPNNSTNDFLTFSDSSTTRFAVASSGVVSIAGLPVVGTRKTGTAANATDLATAITLVNDLKAKLVSHGLIS